MTRPALPPGQQLVAPGKWPLVGERVPRPADGPWRVAVAGCVERPQVWTLEGLAQLPQVEHVVDIHCVTRWSKPAVRFGGVLLQTIFELAAPSSAARFVSFVSWSDRNHSTSLPLVDALELGVLMATSAEGEPLPQEHGGPLRVVVPQRYFYKSLKWLARIELLERDRLGYWESTAGYHNQADPWQEQRYLARGWSRQQVAELLAARDLTGRDLLGFEARGHDLTGLNARGALLRNADFRESQLAGACFDGANLSNAHFDAAQLRGASFVGADLEGASFVGADLRGVDFRGAALTAVTFCSAEAVPSEQDGSAAILDGTTRFDLKSLEALIPEQQTFLAAHGWDLSKGDEGR